VLVQRAADIDWQTLGTPATVGLTAGASAPDILIEEVIAAFRARFDVTLENVAVARESVQFKLPRALAG
jgi:4-hydroxy-3-methylbut-2-enyl diphosphate reductase